MTIVYTKKISSLDSYKEIDGHTDVVFDVYWSLIGEENGVVASCPAMTSVPYTAGSSFVPYDQLTEELVIEWVDIYTTPEALQQYQDIVVSSIAKNSTQVSLPLPWAPPPVPPTA